MMKRLLFLFIAAIAWIQAEEDSAHFAIQATYLYWQPLVDNAFIGEPTLNEQMPFNLQPTGPGKKNKFDLTSGYRISAFRLNNPCCFIKNIGLQFTYLPADHCREVSLSSLLSALAVSTSCVSTEPSLGLRGWVSSHHRLHYYAGDLFATLAIFERCPFSFLIQPGLHYIVMDYRNHVCLSARDEFLSHATLKERANTEGAGPCLGVLLNYRFFDCLTLKCDIKGGLLLARAHSHFRMDPLNLEDASLHIRPKNVWKVFPFWDTKLGFSACFLACGYPVEIEMGYEYVTYPNFIDRPLFPSNGSLRNDSLFTNIDFQGPYFSLRVGF